MPTPAQNQNTRLLESRVETQEQRLDNLDKRMEKYDTIINDLRTIVTALSARSDTDQKWIGRLITIGITVASAASGAGGTVILTHLIGK